MACTPRLNFKVVYWYEQRADRCLRASRHDNENGQYESVPYQHDNLIINACKSNKDMTKGKDCVHQDAYDCSKICDAPADIRSFYFRAPTHDKRNCRKETLRHSLFDFFQQAAGLRHAGRRKPSAFQIYESSISSSVWHISHCRKLDCCHTSLKTAGGQN
eukprot:6206848-Pleurochrysis_carterae.AAC.2